MRWSGLLIIGAWLPVVLTCGTVWFGLRLLFVPAGAYGPWRWAWTWLMIAGLSIGLLWLRNALLVTGAIAETSWLIQLLLNMPMRVILSILTAMGMLGCVWECYRIFRHRPLAVPIPVAQVVMNWRGYVLSWNAAAEDLLGWTEAEVLNLELAEVIIPADLMAEYHGITMSARDAHRAGLQHFREFGESAIMDTRFQTVALHKDGWKLDVEVRVNAHMTPGGNTFLGQITPIPKVVA